MCELGWFRLDGYIIKPAFYTFAVADLGGGARGAVPPPPGISGHTKRWLCCYKNT